MENGAETQEGGKKALSEKGKFWLLFGLWCLFACILPICFIGWRYDLFGGNAELRLSGWGLIAIIIAFAFGMAVFRYAKIAFKAEFSYLWQCVSGFFKVVFPLLLVALALNTIKTDVDRMVQALTVVAIFEAVAVPLNPMPRWVYDKTQGAMRSPIDYFFKKRDEAAQGKQDKGE